MNQAFKRDSTFTKYCFLKGGKWYNSGGAGLNRHPGSNSLASNAGLGPVTSRSPFQFKLCEINKLKTY